MIIYEKGYKNKDLHLYNYRRHQPYDYTRNGLLNKLLPRIITSTKNESTQAILHFVEYVFVWLLHQVDQLKHFKNFNYKVNE